MLGELKDSLDQLRTSYVDMFMMHFPAGQKLRNLLILFGGIFLFKQKTIKMAHLKLQIKDFDIP